MTAPVPAVMELAAPARFIVSAVRLTAPFPVEMLPPVREILPVFGAVTEMLSASFVVEMLPAIETPAPATTVTAPSDAMLARLVMSSVLATFIVTPPPDAPVVVASGAFMLTALVVSDFIV